MCIACFDGVNHPSVSFIAEFGNVVVPLVFSPYIAAVTHIALKALGFYEVVVVGSVVIPVTWVAYGLTAAFIGINFALYYVCGFRVNRGLS